MQKLVDLLKASGMIKNPRVEAVMLKVDRGNYCSSSHPYEDRPQYIGWGSTLSAPHMHSVAIELLEDRLVEGAKVLDIGCGSGFLTACFAHLVGQTGLVVGVDHIKELVEQAEENIRRDCEGLLSSGRIVLKVRDARVGLPEYEQFFDAIHVGASASPEQATKFLAQLKVGGKIVLPIEREEGLQMFESILKKPNGELESKQHLAVRFIPLTDIRAQVGK